MCSLKGADIEVITNKESVISKVLEIYLFKYEYGSDYIIVAENSKNKSQILIYGSESNEDKFHLIDWSEVKIDVFNYPKGSGGECSVPTFEISEVYNNFFNSYLYKCRIKNEELSVMNPEDVIFELRKLNNWHPFNGLRVKDSEVLGSNSDEEIHQAGVRYYSKVNPLHSSRVLGLMHGAFYYIREDDKWKNAILIEANKNQLRFIVMADKPYVKCFIQDSIDNIPFYNANIDQLNFDDLVPFSWMDSGKKLAIKTVVITKEGIRSDFILSGEIVSDEDSEGKFMKFLSNGKVERVFRDKIMLFDIDDSDSIVITYPIYLE